MAASSARPAILWSSLCDIAILARLDCLLPLPPTQTGLSFAPRDHAWALQGLWAAQWLKDVEGLDRTGVVFHLFAMAVALSLVAILLGVAADRLRRRGVGPGVLLRLVAALFIAAQFALMLRVPIPSYLLWAVVAAIGTATVLSFAILAEYFPKQLAGRANGALNLFHIAAAFVVQRATGVVLQYWTPQAGHHPEVAYQTAFALDLALQVAAWIWFMFPRAQPIRVKASRGSRGRISDPESAAVST